MSKVKITGHASGSGTLTLTGPNTNSDRTITLPDETGTVALGVGIDDNADATAITIGADENIGVGVVPEAWHSSGVALQVGAGGTIHAHTTDERIALISNAYEAAADGNWYHNVSGLSSKITLDNGDVLLQTAATGLADSAVSFTTLLNMKADGRGLSQFTAKAWCNFDGTGTPAFRDSHNCSSIDDNGQGDYTINFTNNMGNANFITVSNGGKFDTDVVNDLHSINIGTQAVGSVRVGDNYENGGNIRDPQVCTILVFGD